MNWHKGLCAFLMLLLALHGTAWAKEGPRAYQLLNRLRLELDNNIRQAEHNADSSIKIIEELEFLVNFDLQQTFVGLRYRASFVWWDDREEDRSDFHHHIDFILNHRFTPRVGLSLKNTFRLAELPELIERGTSVREENDFIYNSLNGTVAYTAKPDTRIDTSGRYILLRYDDDDVGEREDYDLYVAGLTLRHQVVPETAVAGDLRYEQIEYERVDALIDRGSESMQVGGSLEHIFSPDVLGMLRGGLYQKDYNDARSGSDESPYGEASFTLLPSPATRITAGAGFSFFETDVYPYTNQERTRFFANLAHDASAKVALYFSAIYTKGEYDGEDLPEAARLRDLPLQLQNELAPNATEEQLDVLLSEGFVDSISDKTEEIVQFSARATYQVDRNNWLEVGLQFSSLDSELREDFERNRIHVGWKTKL